MVGVTGRKPRWLKVPLPASKEYLTMRGLLKKHQLNTVCSEATCPNIGACWQGGHAAFMILGSVCTRNCAFCDVTTGKPLPVDPDEPERLLRAVRILKLKHVVITSVDRDDLADGGAGQFVACLEKLATLEPAPSVEVLTPDFRGKAGALERVVAAAPTIFNHNVETVPRLYAHVRPAADYEYSLGVLKQAAELSDQVITKSGIMLGLGESREEVEGVLRDLREARVQSLTIGQYLAPSSSHHPVIRYWKPEEFEELGELARKMHFTQVESHPLARSSLKVEERGVRVEKSENGTIL
ncbi:MAG: lipoyl synthase [Magnetococcales bacterium]|nr:lipoyl synthase [Magnetococcales bacterium]